MEINSPGKSPIGSKAKPTNLSSPVNRSSRSYDAARDNIKNPPLRCFPPIADRRSKILILGTMPGPVALARREYYGFPGNHFWKIMADFFEPGGFRDYRSKIATLRKNRIALWDNIATCRRQGALDSRIVEIVPNDIPGLIRRYPNIRTIFLNGRLSEKLFRLHSASRVDRPAFYLPSTSPAHASLSLKEKKRKWAVIKKYV